MNLKSLRLLWTFALLLSLGWSTAHAADKVIRIQKSTGTWTKSNPAKTWAAQWTSNDVDPMLTLTCAANNMAYYDGNEIKLFTGNGSVQFSADYTLAVTPDYEIVSYEFSFSSENAGRKIVVTPQGAAELSSDGPTQWQAVKVTDIHAATATFNVKDATQTAAGFAHLKNVLVTVAKTATPANFHPLYITRPNEHPYRIPALACVKDGKLLAFSDYRPGGSDIGYGEVDIQLRTSTDHGATWTDARTIAEGKGKGSGLDFGFGDAAVVADRESNEVLMMCVAGHVPYQTANYQKGNPLPMVRFLSTDGGETWSNYTDVTAAVYGLFDGSKDGAVKSMFAGSGKLCQSSIVKYGTHYRVYMPVCARDGGNRVLYSDDFGATWKVLGGKDARPAPGGDEPKCEELPDGRVLLSSRTNGGRLFNIYTYTNNETGEGSWGEVAKSDANNHGTAAQSNSCNGEIMILPVKRNSDGKQMFLALQSVPFGPNRANVGIYFKALESLNDYFTPKAFASNWTGKKQISQIGSAYSTMVWQKDNKVGFFYEESTYGADYTNVYKALTLEEITDGAFSYDATVKRPTEDANAIQYSDLTKVTQLLGHKGVGFPLADAESRELLAKIYDAPANYNKAELEQAVQQFVEEVNVEKPQNGLLYVVKFVGKDGKTYLVDYADGKLSAKPIAEGQAPERSAAFKAHVLAKGKVAFETMDGKFLCYPTQLPAPQDLTGYHVGGVTNQLDEADNGLDLQKATASGKVESTEALDRFGKFYICSKRGNRTDNQQEALGFWTLDTQANAFNNADVPFLNDLLTSLVVVERMILPLGKQVTTLAEVDPNKAYALYNEHFTTYAVKKEGQTNVWVQGMVGDAGHSLANGDFAQPYSPSSAFGAWQLMKNDQGQWMLYNIGAKQYARTPSNQSGTGPCTFVDEALPINVTELSNGGFAFNTGYNAQQFFCAAPQLADSPINVWTSSDSGSRWLLVENPNVQVDVPNSIQPTVAAKANRKTGIYNLKGQRIQTDKLHQLPAGIYIVDGKKVVVK